MSPAKKVAFWNELTCSATQLVSKKLCHTAHTALSLSNPPQKPPMTSQKLTLKISSMKNRLLANKENQPSSQQSQSPAPKEPPKCKMDIRG
ncbi:hypothetical protein SERLA73DRAFT_80775 [Serpula lacrymans var. lacrymans S7.3]|uniref:Uncharacterized protein n=1 Tax=Serpula lacrymans var. lacrymans (strain S7.3) TaxID=936435 RepID=F8QK92_SERL3|nr:hypothetical protein SERLA73DRAFT_80775 [Serpula lacrymans var. lacrymans S7.3]